VKLREDRLDQIRFGFVAALAMWALCTFSTFVEWMKTGELFAIIKDGRPYVSDFSVYYAAGKIAWQAMHTPTNIYDITLQDQVLKSIIAPVAPEQPWFIQYPPPFFIVTAILPFFTLPVAWSVWVVAGDIFFFWALHYLLSDSLRSRKDFIVLGIAIAASFPFWVCNRLGQAALLTVPSAILFWALVKNGKAIEAGMATALLLVKFQYLPFLGLVGAAQGRVKFVVAAIVSSVVAMLGSGLVLGMQNVFDYPKMVLEGEYKVGVYSGVNPADQQNLRALLVRITGADSGMVNRVCIISCLIVAFIVFAFWLKGLKNVETKNRFKFLATLTICCMLYFSPHAHKQDYLLLTVPACWIWLESIRAEFAGAKWMKRFVISLPFISWIMFVVDQVHPVVPLFTLLLPVLVYAAYETFCVVGKIEKIKKADE
jgi:hypothetical protein